MLISLHNNFQLPLKCRSLDITNLPKGWVGGWVGGGLSSMILELSSALSQSQSVRAECGKNSAFHYWGTQLEK